ncbi:hypothetical protein PJP10_29210 [Mycobacterium kansasii]
MGRSEGITRLLGSPGEPAAPAATQAAPGGASKRPACRPPLPRWTLCRWSQTH